MTGVRFFINGIIGFLTSSAAFGQIISVSQFNCNPNSLNSGASTTCTVTLNEAAPAGGTEVLLSSNNTLLQLGSNSVIVPEGTTSTTFTAIAGSVSTNQNGTLTATALHSVLLNWSASISPNLTNYKVYRGITSGGPYGVVTTLGLVTSYVDSNVQNGQTYYYVTTVVDDTNAESEYSNEASAVVPGLVAQSATISLAAPVTAPVTLSSLVCSPTSVNSRWSTTCSVTLNQPAPNGGVVVSLASNNNLLPVPAPLVIVPANTTSATFAATAGLINQLQIATLTATFNGASRQLEISLLAGVVPSSLTCNPRVIRPGATAICTVNLSQTAPPGGTAVALASNNVLLAVPDSLTVVAGSASATFSAIAGHTNRLSPRVKITASSGGWSTSVFVAIQRVVGGAPR